MQHDHLISKIALRIRQSFSSDEILNIPVQEVQESLGCNRVLMYDILPDETGNVVKAVADGFLSTLGRSFSAEVLPQDHYQLYRAGQSRAIADVENSDVPACVKEFLQEYAVKAFLMVPIFTQGKWGLLVVHHCCETSHWQSFEIYLLEQLTTHIAIAIQQSQFYF